MFISLQINIAVAAYYQSRQGGKNAAEGAGGASKRSGTQNVHVMRPNIGTIVCYTVLSAWSLLFLDKPHRQYHGIQHHHHSTLLSPILN